ncbi:hypothetical protein ACP4OV_002139 [Aristida adscensionis]
MFLPYVSRMLLEEDDTDANFLYQYPDHPALLQAHLPFAHILSDRRGRRRRAGEPAGAGAGQHPADAAGAAAFPTRFREALFH